MASKKKGGSRIKFFNINHFYLFIFALVLIFFIFLGIKYSGYVISTFSRVRIDEGITVIYDNFSGDTTDFVYLNDTQLAEIENMTLEIPMFGKIVFYGNVNLTQDSYGNIVNIDNNVIFLNDSVQVNTSALTSLEVPALIFLYNLNYTTPKILKNGQLCPLNECIKINYTNGTLAFSIIEFLYSDIYSANETPVENVIIPGGNGGGGESGGGSAVREDFSTDKSLITATLYPGESTNDSIVIRNNGLKAVTIKISLLNLSKYVTINESSFILRAKESRTINIDISAGNDEIPDSYYGMIIFKGATKEKSVNVLIDIKKKSPILDLKMNILRKNIAPGTRVDANFTIINNDDLKYTNTTLSYSIKNFSGSLIASREETIGVYKEISIERGFLLATDLAPGTYIFYAKIIHGNDSAATSESFKVEPDNLLNTGNNWMIFGIAAALLIVIIMILIFIKIFFKKITITPTKAQNK